MVRTNAKKHNLYAGLGGIMIAVLVLLSLELRFILETSALEYELKEYLSGLKYFFDVVIPVLLVGVLVLLFTNQGERTFESKWWIPVGAICYVLGGIAVARFFMMIEDVLIDGDTFDFINAFINIFNVAGFSILTIGLFAGKFRSILPVGFCAICFSYIINFFNELREMISTILQEVISIINMGAPSFLLERVMFLLFPIVTIVLLLVLSCGKNSKVVRTLVVIFAVLSMINGQTGILESIAYIIFAILMVPVTKDEFDVYFIPGLLFLSMSVLVLDGFDKMESFSQIPVLLAFVTAPLLLAIYFFFKKFEKAAATGVVLMFVCLVISTFYDAGIAAFVRLQYTLTILVIVKAITLVFFGMILLNRENPKNKIYKVILIVPSVAVFVVALLMELFSDMEDIIEEILINFSGMEYIVDEIQIGWNLLFFCAMLASALVLVPLQFTKYQGIAKHIVLSIVTFGIWQLIWVYHVTKILDITDRDKKYKYCKELLLYLFVPFYYIYWTYKAAFAVDKYAESNGVKSGQGTMIFLLSLVSPLVSSILIQNKINAVAIKE